MTQDEQDQETTNENFGRLLEESDEAGGLTELKPGDRVTGTLVLIKEQDSFIDYGGRSEAVIATEELKDEEGKLLHNQGDTIEAVVLSTEHQVQLTLGKGRTPKGIEVLRQAHENAIPIQGTIKGLNRGGFEVDIAGTMAFCPFSQFDLVYCREPSAFLGKSFSFRVVEWKKGSKNIILSRRAVLEEEAVRQATQTRAMLGVGVEFEGLVVRIQPFGAFVNIGGVEGLVHVSEISHTRVSHPTDVLSEGQQVKVRVIKLENVGEEGERVGLSIRALEQNPWEKALGELREGAVVRGRVRRLADYGAFVELAPGVDGLAHISELSFKRIAHPREVISEGDEIDVKILGIDPHRRRISLSLNDALSAAEREVQREELPQVGTRIKGKVVSVKPFGIFVVFPSASGQLEGLLPNSETDLPAGADPAKTFSAGDPIEAEVISVDEKGKIRLSTRAPKHREEREDRAAHERKASQEKKARRGTMEELLQDLKKKFGRD